MRMINTKSSLFIQLHPRNLRKLNLMLMDSLRMKSLKKIRKSKKIWIFSILTEVITPHLMSMVKTNLMDKLMLTLYPLTMLQY